MYIVRRYREERVWFRIGEYIYIYIYIIEMKVYVFDYYRYNEEWEGNELCSSIQNVHISTSIGLRRDNSPGGMIHMLT